MIPPGLYNPAHSSRQHAHSHCFQRSSAWGGPEQRDKRHPPQPFEVEGRQTEGKQNTREQCRKEWFHVGTIPERQ